MLEEWEMVGEKEGCPNCGERGIDVLAWIEFNKYSDAINIDKVYCYNCHQVYDPIYDMNEKIK